MLDHIDTTTLDFENVWVYISYLDFENVWVYISYQLIIGKLNYVLTCKSH